MEQAGLVAAVLLMGAMVVAQTAPHPQANGAAPPAGMPESPHGVVPSSRALFGAECGIADSSGQSAIRLSRSLEGQWSIVSKDRPASGNDSAMARVWAESMWMVDIHEAPGSAMHTVQMCFDKKGQITRMIDRSVDVPKCDCMRYTSLWFNALGTVARREQRFVKIETGEEIAVPPAANELPEVFGFRRLEQLPFYSLVKK